MDTGCWGDMELQLLIQPGMGCRGALGWQRLTPLAMRCCRAAEADPARYGVSERCGAPEANTPLAMGCQGAAGYSQADTGLPPIADLRCPSREGSHCRAGCQHPAALLNS